MVALVAVVRVVGAVLGGLVLGLLLTLVLGVTLASVGSSPVRVLTVLSGSMGPAIDTGDAVVVQTVKPSAVRVGDVITFRDPADRTRLITHRLRRLRFDGEQVRVTTKGDANTGVERWSMPARGDLGLVRQRLPRLGFALGWLHSRTGRLVVLVIPALLLCLLELRRIWASEPERENVQLTLF